MLGSALNFFKINLQQVGFSAKKDLSKAIK